MAEHAEDRLLVHLEPDAVAEREDEAALEDLAVGLGALRREAGGLGLVADRVVDGLRGHARPNEPERELEPLEAEAVPFDDLGGRARRRRTSGSCP